MARAVGGEAAARSSAVPTEKGGQHQRWLPEAASYEARDLPSIPQ